MKRIKTAILLATAAVAVTACNRKPVVPEFGMLPLMNSRAGGSLRQAGRKCRTACRRAEIVSRNPSAGVRPPQTAGLKITAAAS